MTEELLQDLAEYKKHRVKAVSAASKSLIQVWREKNSKMLVRRDRGRPTEENLEEKMVEYGEQRVTTEIPGLKDLSGEIDENGEKLPTGADFILSQEDFKNIKINELKRKLKLNKKQERADKRRKIGENGDLSSGDETDSDIEREIETSELKTDQEILRNKSTRTEVLSKKSVLFVEGAKRDVSKDARMQSIKDGREDQDKNKMKNRIKENQVGTGTNKQKGKKKAFTMVKHKLNSDARQRKFTDKMLRMRNALQKQKDKKHKFRF